MPKLQGIQLTVFILISIIAIHGLPRKTWQNDEYCGLAATSRIVGGESVPDGKYPWVARIGYNDGGYQGKYVYYCAGALITKTFVITAAHCEKEHEPIEVVHLGETRISCRAAPCKDTRIQEIPVKKFISHPKFCKSNGFADIALIQLKRPAEYTRWVRPICLSDRYLEKPGDLAVVAGWGLEDSITRKKPKRLKELEIQIQPGRECKKHFPKSKFHSRNYICGGGEEGEDTCDGDSGASLMKSFKINGRSQMYSLGVVSYGSQKCGVSIPATFTSIAHHWKWIMRHVLT